MAAMIPLHASDLEQVAEISVETTLEAEDPPVSVIVAQANSLVENPLPEKLGSVERDDVPRQRGVLSGSDVGIRQVNGERCVIVLNDRAQQKGAFAFEPELKP